MQGPGVVILGIDHKIQQSKHPCSVYADEQAEFLATLRGLQSSHRFELIAEEWATSSSTLAREFCDERRIRHQRIDVDEDIKAGIKHVPAGLTYNDVTNTYEPSQYPRYQEAWKLVREFHMFKTFLQHMNSAETALIICGKSHVDGLRSLLAPQVNIIGTLCIGA